VIASLSIVGKSLNVDALNSAEAQAISLGINFSLVKNTVCLDKETAFNGGCTFIDITHVVKCEDLHGQSIGHANFLDHFDDWGLLQVFDQFYYTHDRF